MIADAATVGLLFILGFISLGVAVISVLRFWLVEGTLDFGTALGVLGALLLGSAWVMKTASPLFMLLWIAVMLSGSWLIPSLIENSDKRALHRMLEGDIDKFHRAIHAGVNPAGAWREIGELYLRMNRYDEAIAAFKEAIKLGPHDIDKIRRRLNLAIEYRAGMPNSKTVICGECSQETPKGKVCLHCGAGLETNFWDWFSIGQDFNSTLKSMGAIGAGGAAVLVIFAPLSIPLKALIIMLCVLTGGFLIWLIVTRE